MGLIRAVVRLAEAGAEQRRPGRGDYHDDMGYGGAQGASSRIDYYSGGRQGYADSYNQIYGYDSYDSRYPQGNGGMGRRMGGRGLGLGMMEDMGGRRGGRRRGRLNHQHHLQEPVYPTHDSMGPGPSQHRLSPRPQGEQMGFYGSTPPAMRQQQQQQQQQYQQQPSRQQTRQQELLQPESGYQRQRAYSEGDRPNAKNPYNNEPPRSSREGSEELEPPPPYEEVQR